MALNTVSSERLSTNVKTTNLNSGFGQLSNRNVVKNGAMQIAQRGTSFTSVSATAYHLDRFQIIYTKLICCFYCYTVYGFARWIW